MKQLLQNLFLDVLNYRRPPRWIAAAILLILIFVSIGLLTNPESKAAFSNHEINPMAEVWAEALKTRDGGWWSGTAEGGSEDPFFGTSQWAAGTYAFDRLLYLSPLSSSTFDYAESRLKGTIFTIGTGQYG